jgi:hypothetical protein
VEVADCVKPALKSVQEMEIRKRGRCRILGFRIQIGSKTSYACGSSKVKKREVSGDLCLMSRMAKARPLSDRPPVTLVFH